MNDHAEVLLVLICCCWFCFFCFFGGVVNEFKERGRESVFPIGLNYRSPRDSLCQFLEVPPGFLMVPMLNVLKHCQQPRARK